MKTRIHPLIFFFALTLALAACGSPALSQEAPPTEAGEATVPPSPSMATSTELATETAEATATEEVVQNILRVGDLELVPFAPTWFLDESQLANIVFVEEDSLRIDGPASPFGYDDPPGQNNVFGAVTLESYTDFDISATFNREGGACPPGIDSSGSMDTGGDLACANLATDDCIVFGYVDSNNFHVFCILANDYWFLNQINDGVVSSGTSIQPSDAIRDMRLILYHEHPAPNELRLTMQDNILYAYINGQQVLEQEPMEFLREVGEGCTYGYMDAEMQKLALEYPEFAESWTTNCAETIGKIGVGCDYNKPADSLLDWEFKVANCEVSVALNP